jgi:hypothetical protein
MMFQPKGSVTEQIIQSGNASGCTREVPGSAGTPNTLTKKVLFIPYFVSNSWDITLNYATASSIQSFPIHFSFSRTHSALWRLGYLERR